MAPDISQAGLLDEYRQLLKLTQLYLLQEHTTDQRIFSETTSYNYFKELALQKKQQGQGQQQPKLTQGQGPKEGVAKLLEQNLEGAKPLECGAATAFQLPPSTESASGSDAKEKAVAAPHSKGFAPPPPCETSFVTSPKEEEKAREEQPVITAPQVEPPPPPKKSAKQASLLLELQPMDPPIASDLKEMRALIQENFPHMPLLERIPDDSLAKQQMHQWKQQEQAPAVLILTFNEADKQLALLKNIAKAIQLTIGPTQLFSAEKIEQEKGWEALLQSPELRLVMTSDYGIYSLNEAMKFYKEETRHNKRFLNKVPLLLLPDVSVYLKEPLLKHSLWRSIRETLKMQ